MNVYLSSVYSEFKDIRQKILETLRTRSHLYDAKAMEDYLPEDRDALSKCREDVYNCDIYICILGFVYGSVVHDEKEKLTKSYTHWEFDSAAKKKADGKAPFTRLFFIKDIPGTADSSPQLTELKQDITQREKVLCKFFGKDEDLPQLILSALDNYILSRLSSTVPIPKEKIYLCDRSLVSRKFDMAITSKNPVQFFLIQSHNRDLPNYFVKRKELEITGRNKKCITLEIDLPQFEDDEEFDMIEFTIKQAIVDEINKKPFSKTFSDAEEITAENMIKFLDSQNADILIISWIIQSIHWKNDKLNSYISTFYERYSAVNTSLQTNRRIFFVGILKYLDDPNFSYEAFKQKIANIQYGTLLKEFPKLSRNDIKEWLAKEDIEENPDSIDILINNFFSAVATDSFYFSEIEGKMKEILSHYSSQKNI